MKFISARRIEIMSDYTAPLMMVLFTNIDRKDSSSLSLLFEKNSAVTMKRQGFPVVNHECLIVRFLKSVILRLVVSD